jgi:hypothetical protein
MYPSKIDMRIEYVFLILVTTLFSIYIYLRLRYGFWYLQPVFHKYNIFYYFAPPGIIQTRLPSPNKYTNFQNIETFSFEKVNEENRRKFSAFIKSHFFKNGENKFSPEYQNVIPYFRCRNDGLSFLSFYKEKVKKMNPQTNEITEEKKIVGTISTKPIHIHFVKENTFIDAYYVDYLCVDPLYRKKGVACQLIQTHEYNQRHANKEISVSLFKREEKFTGVVSLCKFMTYAFPTKGWTRPSDLHSMYKFLEINKQNARVLTDFMKDDALSFFDIMIQCDFSSLLELIQSGNIYIHVVMVEKVVLGAFFFRKTCIYWKGGEEFLSCFASVKSKDTSSDLFIHAFKLCSWKLLTEKKFAHLCIDNISHNNILVNNIQSKTRPFLVSPMAYYFYNFASHNYRPEKVFLFL